MGVVPTHEPYQKRTSHGVVLAKDGQKMSKSKGNVINPDEMVKRFGADTLRLYEMFMGPFDQMIPWNIDNMVGIRRFLEKAWRIFGKVDEKNSDNTGIISLLNSTIKKVSGDIEMMKFNTAVSALMILLNKMEKQPHISKNLYATFLKLLSPFAPHISEELWEMLGHRKSIHKWAWPEFDPYKIEHLEVTIVVQINGKVRGRFTAKPGISKDEAQKKAFALPRVRESLNDSKLARIVYVKDRLINIVS
jgi:leucyl-tRNA synthetase